MTSKPVISITAEFDTLMRRSRVLSDGTEERFLEFIESVYVYCKKFSGMEKELARYQEELVKMKMENKSLHLKLKNARQLIDVEIARRTAVEKEKLELDSAIMKVIEMLAQGHVNETRERLQVLSTNLSGFGHGHGADGPRLSLREALSPNHLSTIEEDGFTMGSILNVSDIELTEGEDLDVSSRTRSGRSYRTSSPHSRSAHKRKQSPSKHSHSKSQRLSKSPHKEENKENDGGNVGKLGLENAVEDKCKVPVTPSAPSILSENCDIEGRSLTSFRGGQLSNTPSRHHQQIPPKPMVHAFTPSGTTLYRSPGNSPLPRNPSTGGSTGRPHCFTSKTIYWTDFCQPCEKRIRFGKAAFKCRDCRATCHLECKEAVPLPCVPAVNTPGTKGSQCKWQPWCGLGACVCQGTSELAVGDFGPWQVTQDGEATGEGSIADYAPRVSPMVPALVVHCTNEVEARGLAEVGIYRVPGSDRDVKDLRDRFLRGKGTPNLSGLDIHVICGTLKVFLRSLKEPLIPTSLWRDFIEAAEKTESQDAQAVLYQAISELPQPNRDTLAWIICHLQRVAECAECKMPASNLARVFGPTIIGYSVAELDPPQMIEETRLQQKVMEQLLNISGDYWQTFLIVPDDFAPAGSMFATPEETNSPFKNTRRRSFLAFTPLTALDQNSRRGHRK